MKTCISVQLNGKEVMDAVIAAAKTQLPKPPTGGVSCHITVDATSHDVSGATVEFQFSNGT